MLSNLCLNVYWCLLPLGPKERTSKQVNRQINKGADETSKHVWKIPSDWWNCRTSWLQAKSKHRKEKKRVGQGVYFALFFSHFHLHAQSTRQTASVPGARHLETFHDLQKIRGVKIIKNPVINSPSYKRVTVFEDFRFWLISCYSRLHLLFLHQLLLLQLMVVVVFALAYVTLLCFSKQLAELE